MCRKQKNTQTVHAGGLGVIKGESLDSREKQLLGSWIVNRFYCDQAIFCVTEPKEDSTCYRKTADFGPASYSKGSSFPFLKQVCVTGSIEHYAVLCLGYTKQC